AFADRDEADRHLELPRDREHDAALRRAVELRDREPGHAEPLVELGRLRERVLPLARVDDQQHLVRRARIEARDDAANLLELVHEPRGGTEAPGRSADHDVRAAGLRGGERVVDDRGGIGARGLRDHADARALAPFARLLGGGSTTRVAGGEEHRAAFRAEPMAELADRRRLAGAVDADDEDYERLLRRIDREGDLDRAEQLEQRAAQRVDAGLGRAALDLTKPVDQPRR